VANDPTQRFSDRAETYATARPDYPSAVIDALEEVTRLSGPRTIADVGSGTGIFTRLLLERGHTVHAVEPNAAMRRTAEVALASSPDFHSVDGRAEATTLPDGSVDLVTAAQAYHWFDHQATRREWKRILRTPAWAALIWNDRTGGDPFNDAYEAFLQEWGGQEYERVRRSWRVDATLPGFFGPGGWRRLESPHGQTMDSAGLEGRLLSSSYLPGPDHPRRPAMIEAARRLFDEYESGGTVTLQYETRLYVGRL
jgi:SAM-dependent methyltransferase